MLSPERWGEEGNFALRHRNRPGIRCSEIIEEIGFVLPNSYQQLHHTILHAEISKRRTRSRLSFAAAFVPLRASARHELRRVLEWLDYGATMRAAHIGQGRASDESCPR